MKAEQYFLLLVLACSLSSVFSDSEEDAERFEDLLETDVQENLWDKIVSKDLTRAGLSDWMFERLIKKALEAFKRLMKKGDAKRNIPILDPIYTSEEMIMYNSSANCLDAILEFKNTTTVGLSDFTVNNVSASMFGLSAKIDMTFNSVRKTGKYATRVTIFNGLHLLYGDGTWNTAIEKLRVVLDMHFGLKFKKLYVKNVAIDFNLDKGQFQLENLLHGSLLGQTLNKIASDGTANYLNKNKLKVQPHFSSAAEKKISTLIDGMTLPDLIKFLQALIDA